MLSTILYLLYLIVGVLYQVFITEKYYSNLNKLNKYIAILILYGAIFFFWSAVLIDCYNFTIERIKG
jgi:hypothetical protein